MKLSKLLLTSTTALGLSMSAAVADNNEAFTDQQGNNNDAQIDQTAADNSTVGIETPAGNVNGPALQDGNNNTLSIEQIGTSNNVAEDTLSGALVQSGLTQDGNDNDMTILQSRTGGVTTFGNMLKWAEQDGNRNELSINQTSDGGTNTANASQTGNDNVAEVSQSNTATGTNFSNNNFVSQSSSPTAGTGGVVQDGNRNEAYVDQDGYDLRLSRLEQTGNENFADVDMVGNDIGNGGLTPGFSGASNASGSVVAQTGNRNDTDMFLSGVGVVYGVKQIGNDNLAQNISVTGDDNSIGVGQYGNRNEIALANVANRENSIGINQTGNDNFAWADVTRIGNDVLIGQYGNRNETYFLSAADYSEATLEVTGNDNRLRGFQDGRDNLMDVDFQGNNNNNWPTSPGFSGKAKMARDYVRANGTLNRGPGFNAADFAQGDLFQENTGGTINGQNSLILTGTNANKNAFATYQEGDKNSIIGSISNGNSNQAVVAQIGDNNSASFSQSGSYNNTGIMQ